MKVIDLLNKIAEGEEVPEYIRYRDLSKHEYNTMLVCKENLIYQLDQCVLCLNSEVEVIEEKEIEELSGLYLLEGNDSAMPTTLQDFNNQDILRKINELVRELNKIKKEGK